MRKIYTNMHMPQFFQTMLLLAPNFCTKKERRLVLVNILGRFLYQLRSKKNVLKAFFDITLY